VAYNLINNEYIVYIVYSSGVIFNIFFIINYDTVKKPQATIKNGDLGYQYLHYPNHYVLQKPHRFKGLLLEHPTRFQYDRIVAWAHSNVARYGTLVWSRIGV